MSCSLGKIDLRHSRNGHFDLCHQSAEFADARSYRGMLVTSIAGNCWASPGPSPSKPNHNRSGKPPEKRLLHVLAAAPVAGEGLTARRTLLTFMRYGLAPELASLVRGSSRRITIVRFRPADIRVINRRTCSSLPPVLLLIYTLPEILLRAFPDRVYFGFT